jgi:hypothetical protein
MAEMAEMFVHLHVSRSGGLLMNDAAATRVDFWFDPICPWCWITSRWLIEAAPLRDLEPHWHVMSLAVLNEGTADLAPEYQELMRRAWGPVRVCVAARDEAGEAILGPLYSAIGRRFHNEGVFADREHPERVDEALRAALVGVGLRADIAAAATATEYDSAVRASHEEGVSQVGPEAGTPIVAVGGQAVFGPVMTPAPTGEAAGRLWDALVAILAVPNFYELKRSRTLPPSFE